MSTLLLQPAWIALLVLACSTLAFSLGLLLSPGRLPLWITWAAVAMNLSAAFLLLVLIGMLFD